jgi:vancomycin resistance protein YoaR
MAKKAQIKFSRRQVVSAIFFLLLVTATFLSVLAFFFLFYGKVYPGVYVNSVHLGGLTPVAAEERLRYAILLPEEIKVRVLYSQPVEYVIPLASIEASANYQATVSLAYTADRRVEALLHPRPVELVIDYNKEKLAEQAGLIASQSPTPPQSPKLTLNDNSISFTQGEAGEQVESQVVEQELIDTLRAAKNEVSIAPISIDPTLNPSKQEHYQQRGELLVNKSVLLVADNFSAKYTNEQILDLIAPPGGYTVGFASPSLNEVASAVNTSPKNPVFSYQGGRVKEFLPAADGLEVNLPELEMKFKEALAELESTSVDSVSVDIPVKRTAPEFATEDVNDLGINELIGVGKSTFRGSIPSRVYNIRLAASRLNGVVVKPGEIFSFVNTLGDISSLTGYKQAYIIQDNQTILGDGGGVCQVSTTFFRAALDAGLPIVERHPHSYRVGYYEQDSSPGIDATIYHPTVDIKIKNDTTGHILIQAFADTKNMALRFEFYGTSDGRVATIGKPTVTDVVPPPDDLYVDDPTLPAGEIKQVDYKAWGAKVNFNYKVERNGEIIFEKTFYSNYRPWQARFLRGTGPAQ